MYEQGLGVEQDLQRAVELWREAAHGGDGHATINMAGLHISGDVPLASEDECLQLLTLAAQRGVVEAGAVLGDRRAAVDRDVEALTSDRRSVRPHGWQTAKPTVKSPSRH